MHQTTTIHRITAVLAGLILLFPWFHQPTGATGNTGATGLPLNPIIEVGRPLPLSTALSLPIKPLDTVEQLPLQAVYTPPKLVYDASNTYTAGNCTWYVKSKRPDLPNTLGNADTWTLRAARQGISTGKRPTAGAVGQQGMHVVYVESVQGDLMTLSEMNYEGLYVISTRTVSWAGWNFIY